MVSQSQGSSLTEFTAGAIPVPPSKSRSLLPVSAHTKVRNLDEAEPKWDVGQGGSPLHPAEWASFTGKSLVLRDALSHRWYSPLLSPQHTHISRVDKINLKKSLISSLMQTP